MQIAFRLGENHGRVFIKEKISFIHILAEGNIHMSNQISQKFMTASISPDANGAYCMCPHNVIFS